MQSVNSVYAFPSIGLRASARVLCGEFEKLRYAVTNPAITANGRKAVSNTIVTG